MCRARSCTAASGTPPGALSGELGQLAVVCLPRGRVALGRAGEQQRAAIATVSTIGVIADATRRGAVRVAAVARKPPTGESRATRRPGTTDAARATSGPSNATATTSTSATPPAAAIALSWSATRAPQRARSRRPRPGEPGQQPPPPDHARLDRRLLERPRGRTFAARREPAQTATSAVSSVEATVTRPGDAAVDRHALGREPALRERVDELAGERDAREVAPRRPRARATTASQRSIRRTWRGVAAIARSSAISRSRSWTASPSVPATTNSAMISASAPNIAITAIMPSRASASSRNSAPPRWAPVSTARPAPRRGGGRGTAAGSAPGVGSSADRVRPTRMAGEPPRLGVGDEDRGLALERGAARAAIPTTVNGRAGSVEPRRTRLPTRRPPRRARPPSTTTSPGRAGARPARSVSGVRAALDQP